MIGIFGNITPPAEIQKLNSSCTGPGCGLFVLLSSIFKLAGVVAGIYFIIQIILAGYGYISASGDPKKATDSWTKIWQSILGLAIVAAAFTIAGVVGKITGIDILNPTIQ